jgi:LmbE family N-acetylglucosaminyl deacetylase
VNVLFLFAHNDDEYFASLRIGEELQAGNRVLVAYLTHGSIYGADSGERVEESLTILERLGMKRADVFLLGQETDIFDLKLHERMSDAYRALSARLQAIPIGRVYLMAWEGGHPDHDASHLIGRAYARARGLERELYEFPAYSRLRVMSHVGEGGEILSTATDRRRAFRTLCSAFGYRTQRLTFLALLPGSLVQLVLRGYQTYRRVPLRDYSKPPHGGRLFYERKFHIRFADVIECAGSLPGMQLGA